MEEGKDIAEGLAAGPDAPPAESTSRAGDAGEAETGNESLALAETNESEKKKKKSSDSLAKARAAKRKILQRRREREKAAAAAEAAAGAQAAPSCYGAEASPTSSDGVVGSDAAAAVSKKKKARPTPGAVPDAILGDPLLNEAIAALLPPNYDFEVHKCVHRIRTLGAALVALQMPEGLAVYATALTSIFRRFTDADVLLLADVTYGACCVDDFTAKALGADLLIHYGHSCLVPVTDTSIASLYVFVSIVFDVRHLVDTLCHNFRPTTKLSIMGTIQFTSSFNELMQAMEERGYAVQCPQCRPLSKGEVLGCTSPVLHKDKVDALVYVGDGRFHLESILISNPSIRAYRYDPYSKVFSKESYDTEKMHTVRRSAVLAAQQAKKVGLILGTLGRQGSPDVLRHLERLLTARGTPYIVVLLSEIFPAKLQLMADVECWVQVACPRLSIDWGAAFESPLLNAYEAEVAFSSSQTWRDIYPMDYYSRGAGPWGVYTAKKNAGRT